MFGDWVTVRFQNFVRVRFQNFVRIFEIAVEKIPAEIPFYEMVSTA